MGYIDDLSILEGAKKTGIITEEDLQLYQKDVISLNLADLKDRIRAFHNNQSERFFDRKKN